MKLERYNAWHIFAMSENIRGFTYKKLNKTLIFMFVIIYLPLP